MAKFPSLPYPRLLILHASSFHGLNFIKSSYEKVKAALNRASGALGSKLNSLFQGKIDESTLENLEQAFYEADFGVQTAMELTKKIRELHKENPSLKTDDYIQSIRTHVHELLDQYPAEPLVSSDQLPPKVILIVGVNGNGKTTSVAKLAHLYKQKGEKVLVAAADTFRAAAIDQLEFWANQAQVDIVKGAPKSDPAAVAFDAVQAAKARGCTILLIDTAGRLHTKTPLMQELEKIKRSCQKALGQGPHEIFLVLDATTGQNAIDQAKTFHQFTPLTGIILTKLDGTAKGGIVVAIQRELKLPIKFIGLGEGIEDLQPFNSKEFVNSLFA